MKKVLITLFLIVISWNVGSVIKSHWTLYATHDYWKNFASLQQVFLSSQYVNKHPKGWIPDETAFSYAGGMYIKGINPVLVVPDAPPVGKYIIGLSIILFNNENDVVLISAILSLLLLYCLGMQVFKNSFIALIPPLLFSFEKIFINQLIYTPLLDLFQLDFLLLSIIFFNLSLNKKAHKWSWLILAGFCMGLFMTTKFFVSGLTILFTWYLIIFLRKKWNYFFPVTAGSLLSLIMIPLSYVRVFAFGYSFKAFLGIQKWVFLYHKSQLILPFSIWPLLLFNKWHVWFGNKPVISDDQWNITWPILTITLFLTTILLILKKIPRKKEIDFIIIWPFVYLLFFSVGEIFSRYFVILIPVLYVIATYLVVELLSILKNKL